MRKKLTDTVINTKPPKVGRLEFWDTHLPGFGLRITDKGARSYFVMYRVNRPEGRLLRRLKIGNAEVIKLAEARENAREKLRQVARGIDPAEQRPTPSRHQTLFAPWRRPISGSTWQRTPAPAPSRKRSAS